MRAGNIRYNITMNISLNMKAAIVSTLVIVVLAFAGVAFANQLFIGSSARSAVATTTLAFMTPGVGTTTTPVYDSAEVNGTNETNKGDTSVPNTLNLLIQGTGSSTSSVVNFQCQSSEDKIDWYQEEQYNATSTGIQNFSVPVSGTFTVASTSIDGLALSASPLIFRKIFECPSRLRYTRAVISNTGAGVGIWSALVLMLL